jgi:phosphoglycolate phosphatase-like HAD superfamily hydrolase
MQIITTAIFDFDMTLIDSSIAKHLCKQRDWPKVYNLIHSMRSYPYILKLVSYYHDKGVKIAIISNSSKSYVQRIIDYFDINNDLFLGYHDAPQIKSYIKALQYLDVEPSNVLVFGDSDIDITLANKLNLLSIGCMWGAENKKNLILSSPTLCFESDNVSL